MLKRIMKKIKPVKGVCAALCLTMSLSLAPAGILAEDGAEVQETAAAEEALPTAAPIDEIAAPEPAVGQAIASNKLPGWPNAAKKESDYVCLLDLTTGTALIDKNMDAGASPAALTKIMTTLTAIENSGSLDETVTMTQTGVDLAVSGSANLYTQVGETFSLRDMLYGIMLASANDMAVQVAEYVGGGSVDNFVAMMNERAAEIGCTGTHFVNPSGMTAEGQVSTAHDLALICAEALENPDFRAIASAQAYTIPATAVYAARELTNNFPCLADPAAYGIDGVFGGKTGYTDAALNCIAAFCRRGNREMVAVALHSNDIGKSVRDAKECFQYGYNKWTLRKVKAGKGNKKVSGGRIVTPKKKKAKDCETTETATDAGDGTELVERRYLYGGVDVGGISYTRPKLTPVPTSAAPESGTAVGAGGSSDMPTASSVANGFSNLNAAIQGGTAEGSAAAADPAANAGAVAGAAEAAGTQVGAAAGNAALAGGTVEGTAAAADGTVLPAGGVLPAGTTPAAGTTDSVGAAEPKTAIIVTLPFGVTMNRTSFVAIAVLSLLILLGIILILLTTVIKRRKE